MQFCVCRLVTEEPSTPSATAVADLWGPVELDSRSKWSLGCEKGTNNTAELCGVMQALLWLLHVAQGTGDVVVLCDSHYAMGVADDLIDPAKNLDAVKCLRDILHQVRQQRTVTFTHVKGHSTDGGNDRVDELAWWGKEDGPFSRLARDGSGEGDGRWREEPDFEGRRQRRLAAAASTEEGDDNGESVDDDAASDRRV